MRRGQALVLLAISLFLLALLAFFGIALGVRVRERMELQTLADAAAYDNAVATARTFNALAVVNRTEWSLLVAQSAAQSYLSWSTAYRAALDGATDALRSRPACAPLAGRLDAERQRVESTFVSLEPQAFAELRRLANVQERLLEDDARRDYAHLQRLLRREALAQAVIDETRDSSPWRVAPSAQWRQYNLDQVEPDCEHG
ncbi:MAG: hypothetical protein JNK82_27065, partial [Myxococcaceae bacterium]|nr:hypothetical protein [Myxococcaceae bacterium]